MKNLIAPNKYLALFYSAEKYERLFDKSNISDVYSHKYKKNKNNSDDDLPFAKYAKCSNTW